MRILLTGASGQVGGALKSCLTQHDVIVPTRVSLNLEDSGAIAPFIEQLRPQIVINCAAYTAVDDAERDRARAAQINGTAPGLMAASARAVGAGLIHFSSDYVFDGLARRPYFETDACAPVNFYGQTKLQGERAIADAGGQYLIVRTSWVYGPSGRNFLLTMLRQGSERTNIDVVDDQVGAPTSAMVLANSLSLILGRMNGDPNEYLDRHGGVLHLACAGQTTWHGFAAEIFEQARQRGAELAVKAVRPIATARYPTPARRPEYSVLELTRLQQEFGIVPTPWRDALREVMDQITLSNPTKGSSPR